MDWYAVEVLITADRREHPPFWAEVDRLPSLEEAQAWCRRIGVRFYPTRIAPTDAQHQRIVPVEAPPWLEPLDAAAPLFAPPTDEAAVENCSLKNSPLNPPPSVRPGLGLVVPPSGAMPDPLPDPASAPPLVDMGVVGAAPARRYVACPASRGGTAHAQPAEDLRAAHQLAQLRARETGEPWRVYALSPSAIDGAEGGVSWSPEGYPVEPRRAARRAA